MSTTSRQEQFMQDVIACQSRLYGLLLALLGNSTAADDVLQETNLVLMRKQTDFAPGTNFWAWAAQVARYEVMTYRKRQVRDRLYFDDELVATLAREAEASEGHWDQYKTALRTCLGNLNTRLRDMLQARYAGESVTAIAERLDRPAASVSQTLYRARLSLADCIRQRAPTNE